MAFDADFAEHFAERFKAEDPDAQYKRQRTVTRRDLVAATYDDIMAKRKAGYSFEGIAAHFAKLGAPIRVSTLKSYVVRLGRAPKPRRSSGSSRARVPAASSASVSKGNTAPIEEPPSVLPANGAVTDDRAPETPAGGRERMQNEAPCVPPADRKVDAAALAQKDFGAGSANNGTSHADQNAVLDDTKACSVTAVPPSEVGQPVAGNAPEGTNPRQANAPERDSPACSPAADDDAPSVAPEKVLSLSEIRALPRAASSSFAVPRRKPLNEL